MHILVIYDNSTGKLIEARHRAATPHHESLEELPKAAHGPSRERIAMAIENIRRGQNSGHFLAHGYEFNRQVLVHGDMKLHDGICFCEAFMIPREFEKLAPRQFQACLLRSYGLSPKEIAEEMGIEPDTVQTHLKRASDKLEVLTRNLPRYFAEWRVHQFTDGVLFRRPRILPGVKPQFMYPPNDGACPQIQGQKSGVILPLSPNRGTDNRRFSA